MGLNICLRASPSFAPFAVPFFLQKLASSISSTKVKVLFQVELGQLDTLEALELCAPSYKSRFRPLIADIWPSLRTEVVVSVNLDNGCRF
jgi:hypothetical protein